MSSQDHGHRDDLLERVGAQIRRLRKARDLTQQQLADLVGCHSQTISDRERGAGGAFGVVDAIRFAEALRTSVDQVLGRSGSPSPIPLTRDSVEYFVKPDVIEIIRRASKKGDLSLARDHFGAGFGWGMAVPSHALQVTEQQFNEIGREVRDLTNRFGVEILVEWILQEAQENPNDDPGSKPRLPTRNKRRLRPTE